MRSEYELNMVNLYSVLFQEKKDWKKFLVRTFLMQCSLSVIKLAKLYNWDRWNVNRVFCTIISPNFPVWKFFGKTRFPLSFWRFARNYTRKLGEIMIFYAVCPDLIEPAVSRCATSVRTCIFIDKETAAQFFPNEFCEIFKNTFFTEHLRATGSAWRCYFKNPAAYTHNLT